MSDESRDAGNAATNQDNLWLWLFSSNSRVLYSQDVSNVAGLPKGAYYQFRYREQWLGNLAAAEWGQLQGKTALVVFSFQHSAHLHPAAFVPIRMVKVASSGIEGSFRLVTFEVGENVALLPHSRSSADADASPSIGRRCQEFSRAVEDELSSEGYPGGTANRSAAIGSSLSDWFDNALGPVETWERTVDYLAATGSYPDHLFVRLIRLALVGNDEALPLREGQYHLVTGKTYELELFHYRPQPADRTRLLNLIKDQSLIEIQGPEQLPISSGYDRVIVRFLTLPSDDSRETVLTIEPPVGESGTTIRVNLRITPAGRDKAVRGVLGAAVIPAAAAPGLASLKGGPLHWTILAVVLGAAASSWLAVRSRIQLPWPRRGRTSN